LMDGRTDGRIDRVQLCNLTFALYNCIMVFHPSYFKYSWYWLIEETIQMLRIPLIAISRALLHH